MTVFAAAGNHDHAAVLVLALTAVLLMAWGTWTHHRNQRGDS